MTEVETVHEVAVEPAMPVSVAPVGLWPDPRDRWRWARRFGTLLLGAALVAGIGAVQSARHGWPFYLHHGIGIPPGAHAGASIPAGSAPKEPSAAPRAPVMVASAEAARFGVRIEPVRRERTARTIRAVAVVVPDESRVSEVHTRFSGWIEALYVNKTGQSVRAGQALAAVFSKDLLAAQNELLALKKVPGTAPSSAIQEGARSRLRVLGMGEGQIAQLETRGQPARLIAVSAPRKGVVIRRNVAVGTAVDPSTELMTIADLSKIWVLAEVPERDVPDVPVGTTARLEFPAAGNTAPEARVTFVYPTLTEKTRTLRVRFELDNPKAQLKPGMYGNATFQTSSRETLTVSRDAVVDTGLERHVFVVAGDETYEPRAVEVGADLGDRVEIRSGLAENERVVASGVFLIDSESRLRASGGGAGHAGMKMDEPAGEHAQHGAAAKPAPKPNPPAGHADAPKPKATTSERAGDDMSGMPAGHDMSSMPGHAGH